MAITKMKLLKTMKITDKNDDELDDYSRGTILDPIKTLQNRRQ